MRLSITLTAIFVFASTFSFATKSNKSASKKSNMVIVANKKTTNTNIKKVTPLLTVLKASSSEAAIVIKENVEIAYQPIFEQSKIKRSKNN